MSPAAQYAAVATLTFAVLGFQTIAFVLLGITAALVLAGFVTIAPRATAPRDEEEIPVPRPEPSDTPEEALKQDG
jgi:hypothetical protein